jgi:hypothetical protein
MLFPLDSIYGHTQSNKSNQRCENNTLQQKVYLYTKWFYWIMNKFIGRNEWDLVEKHEFTSLLNGGLVNYTHIL